MKPTKQYTISLLLAIFMIPQVNNAIHYFVVDHHNHGTFTCKEQIQKPHGEHICKQHIFVASAIVLPTLISFICKPPQYFLHKKFIYLANISISQSFSFYTRGPPTPTHF